MSNSMISIDSMRNEKIHFAYTSPEDLDFVLDMENKPENKEFVIPYEKSKHEEIIKSNHEEHLIIKENLSNRSIGFMIVGGIENKDLSLELRRLIINEKGQGYGRSALKLLKEFCFNGAGFHRLWLDVFEDNRKAQDLYISEGFVLEGKLRDVVKNKKGYKTLVVMSMLENEFKLD